jgi:hypothetical protein
MENEEEGNKDMEDSFYFLFNFSGLPFFHSDLGALVVLWASNSTLKVIRLSGQLATLHDMSKEREKERIKKADNCIVLHVMNLRNCCQRISIPRQ